MCRWARTRMPPRWTARRRSAWPCWPPRCPSWRCSCLRKLPYDPAKDFIAVSQAISVPNILVAAPSSPYNSLADFMNAARQKPGRLTYASYGPGSLAQMATELLKADAKFDAVHVPYKGGAPAIVDVMGGQVDVYFEI